MGRSLAAGHAQRHGHGPRRAGCSSARAHFTWMDTNYPAGYAAARATRSRSRPCGTRPSRLLARDRRAGPVEGPRRQGARVDRAASTRCRQVLSPTACTRRRERRPRRRRATTRCAPTSSWPSPSAPSTTPPCRAASSTACAELLVPGAIRSLADRPVDPPLEIRHNGALLNDPRHPYWGTLRGRRGHAAQAGLPQRHGLDLAVPPLCRSLGPGLRRKRPRDGACLLATAARPDRKPAASATSPRSSTATPRTASAAATPRPGASASCCASGSPSAGGKARRGRRRCHRPHIMLPSYFRGNASSRCLHYSRFLT